MSQQLISPIRKVSLSPNYQCVISALMKCLQEATLSACIVGIRREGKREDWIWQIILRHKDKGGEGVERKSRDKNNQDQFRSIGFMTMNMLTMISLSDTKM